MFNNYFYHSHIRKTVAVFGTLFNSISVHRKDAAGNLVNAVKVPLSYGPKQKFLTRLFEEPDLNAPEVALRLPRMSFEITGIQYDTSVKLNKINTVSLPNVHGQSTVYTPVPYILNFQLTVYSKTQDDALQIVEQILPYFNPEYTVTINEVPQLGIKRDLPVVLQSVSYSDDYEGDFATRRVLQYVLDFSMKTYFYGPIDQKTAIIKDVKTNIKDVNTQSTLADVRVIVSPLGASSTDTYTVDEIIREFEF
jgi:hypothetical protein